MRLSSDTPSSCFQRPSAGARCKGSQATKPLCQLLSYRRKFAVPERTMVIGKWKKNLDQIHESTSSFNHFRHGKQHLRRLQAECLDSLAVDDQLELAIDHMEISEASVGERG
jgi:hypothetical protein